MKNSQTVVTETKKFVSETIKYIYFNKLTIKQWGKYFNILKAALETNTPTENILNFAEALDSATVIFKFDNDEANYNIMKKQLKSIIKGLKEPKALTDDKKLVFTPNSSLVQTSAKRY